MSDRGDTFIDNCLRDEAAIDQIDDFVEDWYASARDTSFEAYLGVSVREYVRWMRDPDALASIVESHRESVPSGL